MGCENVSVLTVLQRFPVLIEFFFSVFRFWMIFSTVLQFLMDPNAPPPPLKIVSSVSYENILID